MDSPSNSFEPHPRWTYKRKLLAAFALLFVVPCLLIGIASYQCAKTKIARNTVNAAYSEFEPLRLPPQNLSIAAN